MMHERGKSDRPIVPEKPTNRECGAPCSAEGVEGRGPAEGNSDQQNRDRAQHRTCSAKRAGLNTVSSMSDRTLLTRLTRGRSPVR